MHLSYTYIIPYNSKLLITSFTTHTYVVISFLIPNKTQPDFIKIFYHNNPLSLIMNYAIVIIVILYFPVEVHLSLFSV